MRSTAARIVLGALAVALSGDPAFAAETQPTTRPASKPATRKVTFPLADAIGQPVPDYSLEELARMWPAFKHEPFETAGFNHFCLPFRHVSVDGSGDSREAYAFSFLLSHSIDWAPGAYCAKHAYFVFKWDRKRMLRLSREYDSKLIRFLVNDWDATHAVGGLLRQSKAGYAGTLEIYDRAGKVVLQKEYDKPRAFFELLGDVSVDAIRYFGHEPSAALVEHLHRKRCNHHESIIDLGQAAFVAERSKEEFGIYRKILKRDPGFADVRYWWANQKYWTDRNRRHYDLQVGLALRSYLTEAALEDFDPEACPDKELAEQHGQWIKQAEVLVGPDFPGLLRVHVRGAANSNQITPELLAQATEVAGRYPNSHWLLWSLGKVYENCLGDCDMAASIFLAAMRNKFAVDQGGPFECEYQFVRQMITLGHNGPAAQMAAELMLSERKRGDRRRVAWSGRLLAMALTNMGQYDDAVQVYRIAFDNCPRDNSTRNQVAAEAAIAAALGGRTDVLEQILRDWSNEVDASKMRFLLEAYRDAAAGKPVTPWALRRRSRHGTWWGYEKEQYFYAQLDLMGGKEAFRSELTALLQKAPDSRPACVLFDAYDRKNPKPESASFYETLEWLHGDDPWVRQAVRDYRRRAKDVVLLEADDLLEWLRDFKPARWPVAGGVDRRSAMEIVKSLPPGSIAAAVRMALDERQFDKAEELALRFRQLAFSAKQYLLRNRSNHLVHLVQQAREKVRRPRRKRPPLIDADDF